MARRPSLSTVLYDELKDLPVFLDERAQAHITLPEGRQMRVRSKEFRDWLCLRAYEVTEEVSNAGPIYAVLQLLQAKARGGPRVTLWNRVARAPDGAIWLDLADAGCQAARVTAAGWQVLPAPPLFHRYSHQEALPVPQPGGDLGGLLGFLNLQGAEDELLFLASLVVNLVPDIPQPILILHGPQGSAKTTAARLRRALVDPSAVPTLLVRRDLAELVQALDHHHSPIFDNLTKLTTAQEEVLCQAATGGSFTKRALYTDQEDVLYRFRRAVVLTSIALPSAAADLLDRSLLIDLQRIPGSQRQEEGRLWARFYEERPRLLGALLTVLAAAMATESTLELPTLTRMADFTRWGAAAASAMGYETEEFLAALSNNVQRQGEVVLDEDPLAMALRELAEQVGLFKGTATKLLDLLTELSGPEGRYAGLPRGAAELGRRLHALRVPLGNLGVFLEMQRSRTADRTRHWVLARPDVTERIHALRTQRAGAGGAP